MTTDSIVPEPATSTPMEAVPPIDLPARPAVVVAKSGAIRGVVRLEGPAPKPRRFKTDGDPYCNQFWPLGIESQDVVVGVDGRLANVMVRITAGLGSRSFTTPSEPVHLRQKQCVYEPRTLIVRVGQPLEVSNDDQTMHNVHLFPDAAVVSPDNIGQKPGTVTTWRFKTADGPFKIKCDVHPWMTAWCLVSPHPYAAVTSADGAFAFADLEPGEYTVEAWHEKYGTQSKTVVVDGDIDIQFGYKP